MREYGYFWFYLLLLAFLLECAILLFRRWRKESLLRLFTGNLLIFFFLLAGVLVAAEGYFYFFYDTTDGAMVLLSSQRWKERHVVRNELGFRGAAPPVGVPRGKGDARIAFIGDSYTFGQGINRVEDRFPELIGEKFKKNGIHAAVYNVSTMGWNTVAELGVLRDLHRQGASFDLVVLVYLTNDILEPWNYTPDYARVRAQLNNLPPWVVAVTGRSFAISFLYHFLTTFRNPVFFQYDKMCISRYEDSAIRTKHFSDLADFKAECDRMGTQLAVVTMPMYHPLWGLAEFEPVHRMLDDFWRSRDITNVDLLPEFKKYPADTLILGKWDTHPNKLAHRIVAEKIYSELFEKRFRILPVTHPKMN